MPDIRYITSLDLPELQPYRTLRRPLDHIKQGIFVAEGEKVVRRLLASNLTIVSLLMTPEWYERIFSLNHLSIDSLSTLSLGSNTVAHQHIHHSAPKAHPPLADNTPHLNDAGGQALLHYSTLPPLQNRSFTIYISEKQILESIIGYNLHQGIMAVAEVPEECSLKETISSLKHPHLLVALDGLVNAENVGVVVRNCAGFDVDAILVAETSSSPYLRRSVRNSMGAVFQLPVVHLSNLAEDLKTLHRNYQTNIIAAHPHGEITLQEADMRGDVCIVFGNEGEGISQTVVNVCSQRAAIPMMNETDSLNVASASAVFLYEARKQRT